MKNKIDNELFLDAGCCTIFNNAEYLPNLEILDLRCNKEYNKNRL